VTGGQDLNGFTGYGKHVRTDAPDGQADPAVQPIPFGREELSELTLLDARWAWVEVDQAAIRYNTIAARKAIRPGCRLMAVVKADAYGHGAVPCAKTALASGADYLAVATVEEAVELRLADLDAPLAVLAEPPVTSIPLLLAYRIEPSVYRPEFALAYAEVADAHNMKAPFHLAVNSGMNRIGVRAEEAVEFLRQVSFHRALEQVGTFTHFATADCPERLDFDIQLRRFKAAVESMRAAGFDPGIVHAANSAAIFRYPQAHFDMVRLGISLYGFHACEETRHLTTLKPAMSVYARITNVNTVPMSEGVSYGMHYRSPGSVKICTVPLGYADGLRRGLSGKTNFILDGQYCPQVGSICMDQCMFEVDMRSYGTARRLDPQVGDKVTIVGQDGDAVVTIPEMAYTLGSIDHEVAIGFSHRMPRVQV
jgi:alanine racemase